MKLQPPGQQHLYLHVQHQVPRGSLPAMRFWGAQATSYTLQRMNPLFAGYALEKLCPFTIRKAWPCCFFNCRAGQCGLCAPRWGLVSLPFVRCRQRSYARLVMQKLFAGLRLFKFICRLLNEGCGGRGGGVGTQNSSADISGVRHPGVPRPLQTRPSGTVDALQRNEARVFGAAAFCLLQDDMSHAARRDYVVGAEPSHCSRPDLWEEGSKTHFFGTWSPLPRKPQCSSVARFYCRLFQPSLL